MSDYEVGYGKPPVSTRFQKGHSGNPRGRPPRSKNTSKILDDELNKVITVREGDVDRRISKREALITSLVNDAIKGKNQARHLLLRILEISSPVEPFAPDEDDIATLDRLMNDMKGNGATSP